MRRHQKVEEALIELSEASLKLSSRGRAFDKKRRSWMPSGETSMLVRENWIVMQIKERTEGENTVRNEVHRTNRRGT